MFMFKSRPQETLNQPMYGAFFLPTIMRMSKLSAGVHSHPLVRTPAHTLAPTCKLTLRIEPETNAARLIPERGV